MILPERLTNESFTEFGHVARAGKGIVRSIRDGAVELTRSAAAFAHDAQASDLALDFYDVRPAEGLLTITQAERHEHTSQMFVPMAVKNYLVVVWEGHPSAGARARAFVAGPEDVVIYSPGVWHHGIIALGERGLLASTMWRTRGGTDVEFLQLPGPVAVDLGSVAS